MSDETTEPVEAGPAIETSGLEKSFGTARALRGLDLRVPSGAVFGLLGPNGAGKTTALRILATLSRPDSGTARVFGHDVSGEAEAVRAAISLTGQFASLDQDLSGRENLVLLARLLGLRRRAAKARAAELLDSFGLVEAADRSVRGYSGGMRRRLDIAASMIRTPRLLFLDEPTTGLDPASRLQIWQLVRDLVGDGTTVLLTTQYLDEADRLSDRLAVIDSGRLIAEGPPAELKASVGSAALRLRLAGEAKMASAERLLERLLRVRPESGGEAGVLTTPAPDSAHVADLLGALAEAGIEVAELSVTPPSLDDVFISLTGHAAAAGSDLREAA